MTRQARIYILTTVYKTCELEVSRYCANIYRLIRYSDYSITPIIVIDEEKSSNNYSSLRTISLDLKGLFLTPGRLGRAEALNLGISHIKSLAHEDDVCTILDIDDTIREADFYHCLQALLSDFDAIASPLSSCSGNECIALTSPTKIFRAALCSHSGLTVKCRVFDRISYDKCLEACVDLDIFIQIILQGYSFAIAIRKYVIISPSPNSFFKKSFVKYPINLARIYYKLFDRLSIPDHAVFIVKLSKVSLSCAFTLFRNWSSSCVSLKYF